MDPLVVKWYVICWLVPYPDWAEALIPGKDTPTDQVVFFAVVVAHAVPAERAEHVA